MTHAWKCTDCGRLFVTMAELLDHKRVAAEDEVRRQNGGGRARPIDHDCRICREAKQIAPSNPDKEAPGERR